MTSEPETFYQPGSQAISGLWAAADLIRAGAELLKRLSELVKPFLDTVH